MASWSTCAPTTTSPIDAFDEVIEIDLSTLEPHINGPHSPDRAHPVSQVGARRGQNDWPLEISAALIGSCTNSSYEDITRAASIARQAAADGLTVKTKLLVTPGSERVRATIERDGLLADFEKIGATVLANACGPCIGQWQRDDMDPSTVNTIVNSYNRNFPKRNDGSANTLSFVTSPETVIALALAGTLDFDPRTGTLDGPSGPVSTRRARGRGAAEQGIRIRVRPASRPRPKTDRTSTSSSDPTASASNSSSRSRRGTARTTSSCRSS